MGAILVTMDMVMVMDTLLLTTGTMVTIMARDLLMQSRDTDMDMVMDMDMDMDIPMPTMDTVIMEREMLMLSQDMDMVMDMDMDMDTMDIMGTMLPMDTMDKYLHVLFISVNVEEWRIDIAVKLALPSHIVIE